MVGIGCNSLSVWSLDILRPIDIEIQDRCGNGVPTPAYGCCCCEAGLPESETERGLLLEISRTGTTICCAAFIRGTRPFIPIAYLTAGGPSLFSRGPQDAQRPLFYYPRKTATISPIFAGFQYCYHVEFTGEIYFSKKLFTAVNRSPVRITNWRRTAVENCRNLTDVLRERIRSASRNGCCRRIPPVCDGDSQVKVHRIIVPCAVYS
ncbi:hypothetical protein BC939DRAFT_146844 [Gamsiella multidivaricata]|uniref:uncharacterized protein n=1 Tax=Gamsiella multidivaricata TaxID=101098 RepID=UPI0022205E0B|nr:uncharacterized protein BC939DRAFT_146844 [Gamsiella multidivaricata]KAI7831670.1 hypothetical protein BC939DRAFT_146844 [Gamsiella multidivaricata]